MRAMRVSTFVFSALPAQYRTHNFPVVNNVFDAFVAALSTFTNLLYQSISLFRMRVEVGVNI